MLQTMRLTVGAAIILIAGSALAQPPAGGEYFPLKKGNKWTYKVGDQTVEVVVAGQEKVGDKECWKLETSVGGQVKASEYYYVDATGVYRAKVKDDKIDPAVKVLQFPIAKDAKWAVDSKVAGQVVKGEFKIKDDKAKIKVKAGEFETVMVEGDSFEIAGTKATIRQWFSKDPKAPGPVKLVYVISGTEATLELEKYEEGK